MLCGFDSRRPHHAPIVQWIGHWPPEPGISVRVRVGALQQLGEWHRQRWLRRQLRLLDAKHLIAGAVEAVAVADVGVVTVAAVEQRVHLVVGGLKLMCERLTGEPLAPAPALIGWNALVGAGAVVVVVPEDARCSAQLALRSVPPGAPSLGAAVR